MGGLLLLLLFGDDWRADPPKPKPEIRKVQVDLPPDPPKAKPRKETAAERRKRRAEEKKLEAILKALDSKQQVGLLGVLRADSPGSSVFGSGTVAGGGLGAGGLGTGGLGTGGFGVGSTIGPPQNDREGVHRVVRAHTGAVKYCYEKELISKPDIAGKVTTHFVIDKNGVVTEATITDSTLGDAAVEECLLRQIRSWHFPARATSVTYPFRFENS
jgi:TonB family protein